MRNILPQTNESWNCMIACTPSPLLCCLYLSGFCLIKLQPDSQPRENLAVCGSGSKSAKTFVLPSSLSLSPSAKPSFRVGGFKLSATHPSLSGRGKSVAIFSLLSNPSPRSFPVGVRFGSILATNVLTFEKAAVFGAIKAKGRTPRNRPGSLIDDEVVKKK